MADHVLGESRPRTLAVPSIRAYHILHAGFIALPVLAGIDKFTHVLVNWEQYLSPVVAARLPFDGHTFMEIAGVIEIAAGVLVLVRPRIGGYVVACWLWGIILNLLTMGTYFDVALRDFGLSLGAVALAMLSSERTR